jgi:hypothetical protein
VADLPVRGSNAVEASALRARAAESADRYSIVVNVDDLSVFAGFVDGDEITDLESVHVYLAKISMWAAGEP